MMSIILFSLISNATVYTKQDINSAMCWTIGRGKGYEMGSYDAANDRCLYVDSEPFKDATREVLTLPKNFRGGLPRANGIHIPSYLLESAKE